MLCTHEEKGKENSPWIMDLVACQCEVDTETIGFITLSIRQVLKKNGTTRLYFNLIVET